MKALLVILFLLSACGGAEPCPSRQFRCEGQEIQICFPDNPEWVTHLRCPEPRTCVLHCGTQIDGNGPCCR